MRAAPRFFPRLLPRALPVCLLACIACADAGTSVNLVLTTNPDVCSAAEVLAEVTTVVVVVDAPGGLGGVTRAGPLPGGGDAVDFDGDGELEAVFTAPLGGNALPILEVGLAHNAGRELTYRVLGYPAGAELVPANAVALGGVAATCAAGETRRVGTPFNLRAVARPPRAILVLPPDGATNVPATLKQLTVMLSTTVQPEGLAEAVRLTDSEGGDHSLSVSLDTLTYAGEGGVDERRSLLTIDVPDGIGAPLGPDVVTYTLTVGPGLTSTGGHPFDQDPTTPGADAFVSHFQVQGAVGGGGHPCELCTGGYLCNDDETGCVPALDCQLGCGSGFVCAPAAGTCVEDCRVYGACAAPGAVCDQATGLCG